jgi:hypothetical protein
VALNFSDEEREVRLPARGSFQMLMSTHMDGGAAMAGAVMTLRGQEGCVLRARA